MEGFSGKVAVITGGASGIGLGMAKAFAAAGIKLALADIERPALAIAAAELTDAGAEVLIVPLDVTDRDAVARAADTIEAHFGGVDIICNNAGVTHPLRLDQCTYDDWDWVLSVNLGGVVNGVHTFVPRLKARGGGHVVNTASVAGIFAQEGTGIYATTKYAVVGLSETLADELAPYDIGVSVLCPGVVNSNLVFANRNRPVRYGATQIGIGDDVARTSFMDAGMDPIEAGEAVLGAIRTGQLYILPHAEFKEQVVKRFESILNSFSDTPVPENRLAMTRERSAQLSKMRATKAA